LFLPDRIASILTGFVFLNTFLSAVSMKLSRLLVLFAILSCSVSSAFAQTGIPSDGRDYYIAYVKPSIKCSNVKPFQGIFVLVSSYYDARVEVDYFDKKSGKEVNAGTFNIGAKQYKQIPLDQFFMMPDNPDGEVPEYVACHIHASMPVNCSYYSTGPGSGGMYLALPTGALGRHYVIATYGANPAYGSSRSWFPCDPDSSSSMLVVIAVKDNTHVTITPNATSFSKLHVGKNSGTGARGIAQPFIVTLNRGQVYTLKSENDDDQPDMSGSLVDADQPIGVLAAQESAFNGETQFAATGGDQRDLAVEMMVPVEYWASEGYASAPMMDSPGASSSDPSIGDMFRVYTYDPKTTKVDFWDACSGKRTVSVSQMQNPPTTVHNVQCGINVRSEEGQKIFVEQYDYRLMTTTEPFPAPSQMNVVPMPRWRNSYMWSVPDDKNQVHKRRYVNVIAPSSQITKIKYWKDGQGPRPITSLPTVGSSYSIPNTGGLIVARRFEIAPGSYYATADSTFGLYQYGELGLDPDFDLGDNDGDDYYFSYAAPVGQSFSIDGALRPKLTVDTFCSSWQVHIRDVFPLDGGVAQVELLKDPSGVLKRKPGTDSGYVSTNVDFDPVNFTVVPGDTVVDVKVKVDNPLQDAEGWFWVLNAAGNDTLIHLLYKAPFLTFGRDFSTSKVDSAQFMKIPLGQDSCARFVLRNSGDVGQKSYTVTDANFLQGGQGVFRISGTIPSLPAVLKPGDSVIVDLCFSTNTPAKVFIDTLHIVTDCPEAFAQVVGSSTYPLIFATDWDFGKIAVGQTSTHVVNVKNTGTADLLITKKWLLHDNINFSFVDSASLPITLAPGKSVNLNFMYRPTVAGADSTINDWGTNLVAPFEHQEKDFSRLWGRATAPALRWNKPVDSLRTICDAPVQDTLYLINPATDSLGQTMTISNVAVIGPTAGEWSIVKNQLGYDPLHDFSLAPGDSIWVLLVFTPDITKPMPDRYVDRHDTLIAYDNKSINPFVSLIGHVDHADLASSTNNLDLGVVQPGQTTSTQTVTITNPGTAPLIISDLSLDNPAFHIVAPSLGVGDTIMPGESKTIQVNGTVTQDGDTKGTLTVKGSTNCDPDALIALLAATRYVKVQGEGHEYAPTYVCRNNAYDVKVTSSGSDPVILKTIEIVDDPSMPGASTEFHFTDGTRTLNVNQTLTRDQPYPYQIVFEPTAVQNSKALVRYTYDTARNQGIAPWQEVDNITGPAALEHQTVTAAKNDATTEHFMATSGETFEVPVRFKEVLPGMADAHQLQFDFTFRRDLFHYNQTLAAAGYTIVNVSNGTVSGSLETRTITIQPTSSTTFGNADELLRVSMQLMVARDTNSDFIISNALYTDSKGNDICYIIHNELPGAFTPIDLCGNDIMRRFLESGVLTYGIREVGPNPATSTVNVTLDVRKDKSPISIEVYNALGNRVYSNTSVMSTGIHTSTVDVSSLSSGEYTVRIASASGQVQSKKLVIQK
jgi:hypothetical protein